jgi:acetolactate synthase-1/2/3 large subunit
MTGAEIIFKTAAQAGVEICFANPGTTELALVAALDTVKEVRPVLGLFEGVCTGAADGYGRVKQKPAMTVLHLGPGFANGIANLHNARRARSPILNIIGEHTTWIRPYDPPLNMDIASLARTVSGWQKESISADVLSADTAEAIAASLYGQISTMIVPANYQSENPKSDTIAKGKFSFDAVDEEMITHAVSLIKEAKKPALILGDRALRKFGLAAAAQIKAKTDCDLLMTTFPAYFDSGVGLPVLKRIPYFPGQALKLLAQYDAFVMVGAPEPTAFFGYAGGVTSFLPDKTPCIRLDSLKQDAGCVLEVLSSFLGPDVGQNALRPALAELAIPVLPDGPLTAQKMCQVVAALQPENCLVVEEGVSSGAYYYAYAPYLKPYSQMTLTGGAIGMGLPLALGAALAAPDRQVIDSQADGSALYTMQALWSQAHEKTKVITVICSNRKYFTIELECLRAGYKTLGDEAKSLMNLDQPNLDWVSLSRGMGVPAASVNTAEAFIVEFQKALRESGPYLIEAILE